MITLPALVLPTVTCAEGLGKSLPHRSRYGLLVAEVMTDLASDISLNLTDPVLTLLRPFLGQQYFQARKRAPRMMKAGATVRKKGPPSIQPGCPRILAWRLVMAL